MPDRESNAGNADPREGGVPGISVVAALVAGSLLLALSLDPIAQPLSYHAFADDRRLLGIDNFWNVASNLPFLVFGLAGLVHVLRHRAGGARLSWGCFFAALVLVSLGSAWYHLAPDNGRLAWDRLPIAAALTALFTATLAEHAGKRYERFLLPAIAVGIASVIIWHATDDLRLYFWVQTFTLLGVVVLLTLFRPRFGGRGWLLAAFACFMLAKAAEHYDALIYAASAGTIGGHALKHVIASFAPLCVQLMLMRRAGSGTCGAES